MQHVQTLLTLPKYVWYFSFAFLFNSRFLSQSLLIQAGGPSGMEGRELSEAASFDGARPGDLLSGKRVGKES